jgi:polar amino acid transport system substrate-binding protein
MKYKTMTVMTFVLMMGLCLMIGTAHVSHAAQRSVVFATTTWEPLLGENLPGGGFYTEISRAAFQRVDYEFTVEFVPWKRAVEETKKGNYDGLLAAGYSEERAQFFSYTDPVYIEDIVFFCRANESISYASLQDLQPYTIGVLRGSLPGDILQQEPSLTLEEVSDDEFNINKLVEKRIDLFVSGKIYILHLLQTQFPEWKEAIEVIHPPLEVVKYYNPVSKTVADHDTIVADFNRGLQMIKEDGTFDQILQKHGFGEQKE